MSYETDERIKNFLDTNQLARERMCRDILAIDKQFSDVKPRHPRGGADGGRDIQAIYRGEQIVFGAIGFMNQANDSVKQKKTIKKKFKDDLNSATNANSEFEVFIFFTNINLTISEKDELMRIAKKEGIFYCDIFDRERIRIALDTPDGFSIRFEYLKIPLTEAEQASFFSRWGDDIQSLISSGFQKVESTLNRVLFLQEANSPILSLIITLELNKKYSAKDIGHFRIFCHLILKEPKHKILSILFGSSDKLTRMMKGEDEATNNNKVDLKEGIKHGISSGQWEQYIDITNDKVSHETWTNVGSSLSKGIDEVEFLSISYRKNEFIRFSPVISLKDLDDAIFLLFLNESLAKKIKAIHIYSNGYKLKKVGLSSIKVDTSVIEPNIPVKFNDKEMNEQWVKVRPKALSAFDIRFFEDTPRRLFAPNQIESNLDIENQ